MEAYASAHYRTRTRAELGQEVKLKAAQFVRPFVKASKTDVADERAIWDAAQRPRMKFVEAKSEGPQGVLTMHQMREQRVKVRTLQANQCGRTSRATRPVPRRRTTIHKDGGSLKDCAS